MIHVAGIPEMHNDLTNGSMKVFSTAAMVQDMRKKKLIERLHVASN
jgi:hypothetical protein